MAQLKKIVLQPEDLPAGWKGKPYKADPSDSADTAAFARCMGVRNTDPDEVAEANSDDFDLGDAEISSSAGSYRSQSDLDVDISILHNSKAPACFKRQFSNALTSSLPAGSKIDSASVKVVPPSGGSPANLIATADAAIKMTVHGQKVAVYVTSAFITGPLIEAEVDVFNIGAPVSASLVKSLAATVAARAAKG